MEQEITLRDVANYLDNVGIQFLATIGLDGKPKVRPMQYMVLEDEKLWFCTNSKKEVFAELQANPIFKVFYLKNIDGWMTNLGHVKGLEQRD